MERLKAEAAGLFKGRFDQFDHLETVIRAEMDTARGDPAGVAGHFRSALAAPFSPRTYLWVLVSCSWCTFPRS